MDAVPYLTALSALAGLGLAAYFFVTVTKESPGNERMVELMNAIQEGAHAFLRHRGFVTPEDVRDVALDVLRHRVLPSYEAVAEGWDGERLVQALIEKVPLP